MNGKTLASMAVVAVLLMTAVLVPTPAEASGGTDVLFDEGNGSTQWVQADGATVGDTVSDALVGLGIGFAV